MNIGIGFGIGFTLGIPLGAALTATQGPDLPLYLAAFLSVGAAVATFFLPVCDVNSSLIKAEIETNSPMHQPAPDSMEASSNIIDDKTSSSCWSTFMTGRHFPSSYSHFFQKNRPDTGFYLIKQGKCPYDWLSIFSANVANQVLRSVFINFAIEAYGWSTILAGIVVSLIGMTVAITAPYLSRRYDDTPLFFLGIFVQFIGYVLLAISGAGLDKVVAMSIGSPGILLFGIGAYANSIMQSIITAQYPKDQQGEVGGVLSQISILSIIPAYPIALLLSYTQSSKATFYWPGMPYAVVNMFIFYINKHII